jgi:hypothetical protein
MRSLSFLLRKMLSEVTPGQQQLNREAYPPDGKRGPAVRLSRCSRGSSPVRSQSAKINFIPYNTVEGLEWSRPSRQEKFQSILRNHGVTATLRREKGHDIAAACGQLRLQIKRAEGEVRRMTA